MSGFSHPVEELAMIAGVATYVVAFAWITALPAYRDHVEPGKLGSMLRIAANTRAALAPLMMFGPDLWLGMSAVAVVQAGARMLKVGEILAVHSFAWTYLMTLVQGALVSATMGLLVLIVWAVRAFWQWKRC